MFVSMIITQDNYKQIQASFTLSSSLARNSTKAAWTSWSTVRPIVLFEKATRCGRRSDGSRRDDVLTARRDSGGTGRARHDAWWAAGRQRGCREATTEGDVEVERLTQRQRYRDTEIQSQGRVGARAGAGVINGDSSRRTNTDSSGILRLGVLNQKEKEQREAGREECVRYFTDFRFFSAAAGLRC